MAVQGHRRQGTALASRATTRSSFPQALLFLIAAAFGLLLTGCGDETPVEDAISTLTTQPDGGGGEQPPETDPPETETSPTETDPPETETSPTETSSTETAPTETSPSEVPPETSQPDTTVTPTIAPEASGDEPALSIRTWLILAAIVVAGIVVFVIANTGANRRAGARASAQSRLQNQLGEVVGGARWVHDSGSIEVLLSTDANQIQSGWNEVRRRMVNIESQIATLAVGTGDPALDQNLRYLGQCLADLRGSEEAYVAAKVRSDGSAAHEQLVRSANDTVMARRQQLQAAIDPVAYAMRA